MKKRKQQPVRSEPNHTDIVSGILRMHPKGFGFVIPNPASNLTQDIFIPKHLTDSAIDGDTVEVAILDNPLSEKGPEGKIVSVIKRSKEHLCGTIQKENADGSFSAYMPILGISKPVLLNPSDKIPIRVGSRVVVRVIEWGNNKESTKGELLYCLGSIEDPSCDIQAAIEEFDLSSTFPQKVVTQAKSYGKEIPAKELKKRKNLTSLTCITIDPETAKDFDDALSLSVDRKGIYHLGVHIADAAHYVTPGSPLDKEAFARGNSTYLPGTCVPMLPEQLSNELCSLQPDKERLTVSVFMDFDKQGNLLKHEICRAVIKSKKRFTYEEAKEVLDGKLASPHKALLQKMNKLCLLLRKKRQERGSIDFSIAEIVIVLDKRGDPQGVKKIEYDITHQLVEEFMLKANEMVATELFKRKKELIYRVHEEPLEENISDFLDFARRLGFVIPREPSTQDFQKLFQEAKETPYIQQLSIAFIRCMRLAQYSQDNIGHFGLALENYCHFTSPIRRYSDLIIQRLLFNEEPKDINLEKIARHCSDQERVSFRAEMSVKTLKKLRLLAKFFKKEPEKKYPALVTKVKPFGFFFEIQEIMLEGFIHISEIGNDYYIHNEKLGTLVGKNTGKTYKMADPIEVEIDGLDLVSQQVRWRLCSFGKKQVLKTRKRRS